MCDNKTINISTKKSKWWGLQIVSNDIQLDLHRALTYLIGVHYSFALMSALLKERKNINFETINEINR